MNIKKVRIFSFISLTSFAIAVASKEYLNFENSETIFSISFFIFGITFLWGVFLPILGTPIWNSFDKMQKSKIMSRTPLFYHFFIIREWEKRDE